MDVRIERVRPADWQRYRAIRLRALADAPSAYASSLEVEQHHTAERWQELLAGASTFLAGDGDQILGTATGWAPDPGAMHLVAMYVVPRARGRRLAHLLIDEVRRAATEAGASRLLLEVAEDNVAAARCYRAYGFVPTGHRQPMERDRSILEIEMELSLADPLGRSDPAQVVRRAVHDHDH